MDFKRERVLKLPKELFILPGRVLGGMYQVNQYKDHWDLVPAGGLCRLQFRISIDNPAALEAIKTLPEPEHGAELILPPGCIPVLREGEQIHIPVFNEGEQPWRIVWSFENALDTTIKMWNLKVSWGHQNKDP